MFTQNRANNFSAKGQFIFKDQSIDTEPLEYNIIQTPLPSLTLTPVVVSYGNTNGNIPGDRIQQEQSLVLNFILDESLEVLFSLMQIQTMNLENGRSDDLFVMNIVNNKNKVIAKASFQKVWIEVIGGIEYIVQGEELTVILPVTISFFNYNLDKVV